MRIARATRSWPTSSARRRPRAARAPSRARSSSAPASTSRTGSTPSRQLTCVGDDELLVGEGDLVPLQSTVGAVLAAVAVLEPDDALARRQLGVVGRLGGGPIVGVDEVHERLRAELLGRPSERG